MDGVTRTVKYENDVPAAPGTKAPLPSGPALPAHFVEIPPNAAKTLAAVREMGYDSMASIMDLIDNSIDAGAKRVAVSIREVPVGSKNIIIEVLDDGCGMDQPTLNQALRLGSDTERTSKNLGKYGMGLVSASLSMARSIYVLSRKDKAQAWEANFDMGMIEQHNKFIITLAPATASAKVVEVLGDRGTLVRLTSIDRISDRNVARFAAALRTKLAQVYRNFIGKSGMKLSVNNKLVAAADPLMRDHPETQVVYDDTLTVAGVPFRLTAVELPDLGTLEEQEYGIFPHNSGFYILRNGRQIIGGETLDLYRHHHSYSHFRAELSFAGDADDLFHVDVKKSTILPDERVMDKIRDVAADLIAASGKRGRDRGTADPVKLRLEHATDVLNARLAAGSKAEASIKGEADDKAEAQDKGKAEAAGPGDAGADDGQGEDTGAKSGADRTDKTPKVRFGEFEGDPHKLYRAVEKGGQWFIELNTKHPLVRTVGEAKHKAASAVLTYVVFALAQAEDMRNGPELVASVGDTLATILGVPAETAV
jgi:hypothetical protein